MITDAPRLTELAAGTDSHFVEPEVATIPEVVLAEAPCQIPFLFISVRTDDDPTPQLALCDDQACHDGQVVRAVLRLGVEMILLDDGARVLFALSSAGIAEPGCPADEPLVRLAGRQFKPEPARSPSRRSR